MSESVSLTAVIKGGLGLYIKSFLATAVFAIVSVMVPYHLVSHFSLEQQLKDSIQGTQDQLIALLPELATSSILSVFMYCVCVSIVLLMLYQYSTIGKFNIRISIIEGLKRFFRFFIVYLVLYALFSLPWMVMYTLPPNVAMISAVVYAIVAVYVSAILFLFPIYLVCNNMGIKDAIKESIQAVKGNVLKVMMLVVVMGIIYSILRYFFSQIGIALPVDSLGENLGVISDMIIFALVPAVGITLFHKLLAQTTKA